WSWSTTPTLRCLTLPPNAYPRTTSCTIGNVIDIAINTGLRRKRRSSLSIIAHVRPIAASQSGFGVRGFGVRGFGVRGSGLQVLGSRFRWFGGNLEPANQNPEPQNQEPR